MILEKGNMWDVFGKTSLFCITTNLFVKNNGEAVMGRGIAKEAATRFPELPKLLGDILSYWKLEQGFDDPLTPTFFMLGSWGGQNIAAFSVKYHWREKADLGLIARNAKIMAQLEGRRIDMNFPGIGNGKLGREEVLPLIEQLPDNIHIWELK